MKFYSLDRKFLPLWHLLQP